MCNQIILEIEKEDLPRGITKEFCGKYFHCTKTFPKRYKAHSSIHSIKSTIRSAKFMRKFSVGKFHQLTSLIHSLLYSANI